MSDFVSTGPTREHFYDCVFADPSGFAYTRYLKACCHVVQPLLPGVGPVPELRWTDNTDEVQPVAGIGQPFVGALYVREVAMVLGLQPALYVVAIDGPADRQMVHSTASVDHAYEQAVKLAAETPGAYNEITVFMKADDCAIVHARRAALPLGEGGFEPLRTGPAIEFLLATATLTHDGKTHERVVVSQHLAPLAAFAGLFE